MSLVGKLLISMLSYRLIPNFEKLALQWSGADICEIYHPFYIWVGEENCRRKGDISRIYFSFNQQISSILIEKTPFLTYHFRISSKAIL